jgi:predicted ATPase
MTDGVAIVPLDAVRDADLVAPAIGQAVGIVEIAGQPLVETLLHYLHNKRLLLLLDQITPVAAPIIAALLTVPELTILATSRAPIGVPGECVYLVTPLSLPEAGVAPTPGALMEYGATHLFIVRACGADPAITFGDVTAAQAVTDICRLVAGLPLGIELAAARIATLSPQAVRSALRSHLPSPPVGHDDPTGFERTLHATIAWSEALLPGPEQRLLARLSIFTSGCTPEAASAVCDAGSYGVNIEDGLRALCAVGLVQQTGGPDDDMRYGMLEPIHAYAAMRLATSGDDVVMWQRFVAYCLTFAAQTELMLRGPRQVQWLNRLEAELGNVRAILRWAFDRGDVALGLRLAGSLDRFWQYHTHVSEGRQWLTRGLGIVAPVPPAVHAKALSLAGWLARFQDEMDLAEALLAEAHTLYRGLDDRRGIADVTDTLGDVAHFQGDQERARELHERNLALRRELGDRWGVAMSLNSLGWIALAQRDQRRALLSLQESLTLVRQLGDRRGIAMVLTGLGWVSLDRDDARQAQVCMREGLVLFRDLGSMIDICLCLEGLGAVAGLQGEAEKAARLFGAAYALRAAMNIDYAPVTERHYARHRETARAQIGADTWSGAWAAGRALSLDQAILEACAIGATSDSTTSRME